MKTYPLILALLPFALATCVHNDRLPNADHVVLGRIENVSVVDRDGNPVAPEPRTTSENALIKLDVCTTHKAQRKRGTD